MTGRKRYAIITPYYKESRWLIERCIRSVQAQTIPVEHFLIADGYPQDWIVAESVRHLKLDRCQGNNGNTPRAIGALMAVSEGYEGIGLLDADNWFETTHVSACLEASRRGDPCDYVIARRNMCRPDGSVMPAKDDPPAVHVDTSCFFFLPGSYHVIPHFGLMPNPLSPICDRVFLAALKARNLKAQIVEEKTVNYHCLWQDNYQQAGEIPPPDAKPDVDWLAIAQWWEAQDLRQAEIINRRCGSIVSIRRGTK